MWPCSVCKFGGKALAVPRTAACRGAWCTTRNIIMQGCGRQVTAPKSLQKSTCISKQAHGDKPCLCPQGAVRGPQPGCSNRHSVRPLGQGHVSQRAPSFGHSCQWRAEQSACIMITGCHIRPAVLHWASGSLSISNPWQAQLADGPWGNWRPHSEPEPLPVCTHRPWCRR